MIFKIGDIVQLKGGSLIGFVVEEEKETSRYKVKWFRPLMDGRDTSWASYDRIVKVY